jgi:hypothetical protein
MLQPGRYTCKVTAPVNGWFGEAGEHNTPYIRIPLIVTEDGDGEGDRLTHQAWISDKSLDRTVKNLAEVFGWDGDIEALAKLTNTGPFVGQECSIVTEEEEYNGKKRVVIKWLNTAGGGGKTMESAKAASLARRLAERAKKAAATAGDERSDRPPGEARRNPPPPAKRQPSDPDLDAPEDDIPF